MRWDSDMPAEKKLQHYLELAKQVRIMADHIANEASQRLRTQYGTLTLRDRVLIGLAVKMYNSFECLVKDARQERSEAMHHLKTLVETYILFHWVGHSTEETRAKLVFAKAFYRKLVFFEKNPGYTEQEVIDEWKGFFDESIRGLEPIWKEFKKRSLGSLASDVNPTLAGWYHRVYSLACEPAHVSDLQEYMPLPNKPIQLGWTQVSPLRADIALDYGLHVILDVLKNASVLYGFGLDDKIRVLQENHSAVRGISL